MTALAAIALTIAPPALEQCRRQSFEVASVRLTPKENLGYMSFGPSGTNRYTLTNAGLSVLVQVAYGIPFDQISGIEKLSDEHFNVTAKAEDGVILTSEQLQPRMRQLLEQRFKLAAHTETKDFDGYALVVAKGGPKLKPPRGPQEAPFIPEGCSS